MGGCAVAAGHRQNLHGLVIGKAGVAFAQKVDASTERITELREELRECEAAFTPAMLGASFVTMQPEPTAGLRYSLFELAEPHALLTTAMSAIGGGAAPVAALADFVHDLGDALSLTNWPLPGGAGTDLQAVGPIFTPEAFDDTANGRASMKAALETALTPRGDAKVAMGVIDTSIAFVNARFRKVDPGGGPDRTRFEMLWIQGRAARTPGPYASILRAGTLLLRQDIDALIAKHWKNGRLDEAGVYAEFTRPPTGHSDLWSMRGGHGTTVLDLMAGARREDGNDDAPIYGVELPVTVVSDTSGAVFHGPLTFGLGLIGLASYALSRTAGGDAAPLVANASMGFLGGPHDGSHPTAATLNAVASASKGPASALRDVDLTLPVGNHLQDRIHARAIPASETTLTWSLPPEDRTASFVEIWSETPGQPPDVTELTLTPPGETGGVASALPAAGERIHLEVGGKRLGQLHNLGTHLIVGVYATSDWTPGAPEAPGGPRVRVGSESRLRPSRTNGDLDARTAGSHAHAVRLFGGRRRRVPHRRSRRRYERKWHSTALSGRPPIRAPRHRNSRRYERRVSKR